MAHSPVDVSTIGQIPGTSVICTLCGNHLVDDGERGWRIAGEE
ncbi:hypothetical protein [Streptomyces sp. NPDC020983]